MEGLYASLINGKKKKSEFPGKEKSRLPDTRIIPPVSLEVVFRKIE